MAEYQYLRSSLEMSRCLYDALARVNPYHFPETDRSRMIRLFNDRLQGRNDRSISLFLEILETHGDDQGVRTAAMIRDWIDKFANQRSLLTVPCDLAPFSAIKEDRSVEKETHFMRDVDQSAYDTAVAEGFPPDFFKCAEFFAVRFYCLPDHADFSGSWLKNCEFAVCRVAGASFDNARIYDTQFHSCRLDGCTFNHTNIAHTHFRDSAISDTFFQYARLNRCNTIDCSMERIGYTGATLDGCTFDHVDAKLIRGLSKATITQGGATEEERNQNRSAVLTALHAAYNR